MVASRAVVILSERERKMVFQVVFLQLLENNFVLVKFM